jgi:mRNA-degrading endonuclease HigB of HigAB toxin-antitoxin module
MHIISRKKLREFSRKHADVGNALNTAAPPKPPQQIWSEFEQVVAKISAQYHEKQPSN